MNAVLSYDSTAQALYLLLRTEKVVKTENLKDGEVYVDMDKDGQVIGIEVLGVESVKNTKFRPNELRDMQQPPEGVV